MSRHAPPGGGSRPEDGNDTGTGMGPGLALVSRGDPLTPYLHSALAERYPIAAQIDVELRGLRRAVVGGLTVRPSWRAWSENYMKSNVGFRARSRLADRALRSIPNGTDAVVQTHALFATGSDRATIYVDCTYAQAARGWPAWTPHRGPARMRWLANERRAYLRARHLFAFTEVTRRSLIEDYDVATNRISVVGSGVNFVEFPSPAVTLTRREPVVLFVGKDFERKGGPQLLDAFALVRSSMPAARMQIVGPPRPAAAPAGVEFLGRVDDRARMKDLYAHASVFCLPSLFDPSPLVVLEAMAHGLPCVLSYEASHHVRHLVAPRGPQRALPDVGQAALVTPTGDVGELAETLSCVLEDPATAATIGARAYHAVRREYLWQHVVDRMAPVLDATQGSPSGRQDQAARYSESYNSSNAAAVRAAS